MTELVAKFFTILAALLGLYSKAKRDEELKDAQHSNDSAQSNPVDWFDGHFNGVQHNSAVPSDARSASQANAEKSETK